MIFTFEYEGCPYSYDDSTMSLPEARYIKRHSGLTGQVGMWPVNVQMGDPDAVCLLLILAQRRAGEKANWEDLPETMNFAALVRSIKFTESTEVAEEMAAVAEAQAEVARTQAALDAHNTEQN